MPGLYLQEHREPYGARLGRVKVLVGHPGSRFALQAGRIEVGDIVDLAIEEVQDIEADPRLLCYRVAQLRIQEHRGAGALRIVFDEGPWSKVAQSQTSVPRSLRIRQAARHGPRCRPRNIVSNGVFILEARLGKRQLEVRRDVALGLGVACPFDALATAGTAGFSRSRIAREDQFGIDIESPQCYRGVRAVKRRCAKADLTASRSHKWRYALRGSAALWFHGNSGSACVIAVESVAIVEEVLDL